MKIRATFLMLAFMFLCFLGSAQNILINDLYGPNEPSIMMDPKNTNLLVAGSSNDFVYTSVDGGYTWDTKRMFSTYGVKGGAVIDVDTTGTFYYFHLSGLHSSNWLDRIVCQRSNDNGATWDDLAYTGFNGTKHQDKQWSVVDRKTNNIYLTWTQFDTYGSTDASDSTVILFSKSTNQGSSWSKPIRINKFAGDCFDDDNTVKGAVPAVGPNGEIYVSWMGPKGLVFNRSLDQGKTWLKEEIMIDVIPNGWNIVIPGINRANGLPITKCDLSGGPNHGTIYINWSDQRNGVDDTDIWLTKSSDGGNTWSKAKKVNTDNSHRHQFFTWMDIDQTNGNLYFVFYDRRAYDDTRTDVYLASSDNGGHSFLNKKITPEPFTAYGSVFFGDYTNITAHNNIVRPIWTHLSGIPTVAPGELRSIWTSVTPAPELFPTMFAPLNPDKYYVKLFPNPIKSQESYVSFILHKSTSVSLVVYDHLGRVLDKVYDNEWLAKGKHVITINNSLFNNTSGVYLYKIVIEGKVETFKVNVLN